MSLTLGFRIAYRPEGVNTTEIPSIIAHFATQTSILIDPIIEMRIFEGVVARCAGYV